MESPLGRLTLSWYCRFDLYGALIGGYSSSLPLEWFTYGQDYSNRKVEEARGTEEYVPAIIDKALTDIRFLAMEISNMSCAVTKGRMSFPDYFVKEIELTKRLKAWHADLDPVLYDPRYCVTDFSDCPPPDPNDIVDPYQPGLIYDGPIWPMTILQQDFLGLYLMMKYMTVELKQLKEGSPEYSEIQRLSFSACQIFESVALWPRSPKGAVIGVQACIGMGCVLFPKDDRHMWWLRKSMAIIERAGYGLLFPTIKEHLADTSQLHLRSSIPCQDRQNL